MDLIGQLSLDIIGRLSIKLWCHWLWRLQMSNDTGQTGSIIQDQATYTGDEHKQATKWGG